MIEELGGINNNEQLRHIKDAEKKDFSKKETAQAKEPTDKSSDKLNISSEARQALEIKEFVNIAKAQPEVRKDVVEKAKQELEDGTR